MDAGLLIARVVFGLLMAAHGAQKLLGWFGGYGLAGTAAFFEQLGFRPGRLFAGAAAGTELVAGVMVAFGLLGPLGPALALTWSQTVIWTVLGVGVIGGFANLAIRKAAPVVAHV